MGEDTTRSRSGPWLLALLALLGPVATLWVRPPSSRPADAPLAEFSADRAWTDLLSIASGPRAADNTDHRRVRALLSRRLEDLGLEVQVQRVESGLEPEAGKLGAGEPDSEPGPEPDVLWVENVIGRRRGTGDGKAVLVDVHYDSVEQAPGAGDNGAAVAATLEALRAFLLEPAGRNDVIILFSDLEELGMVGTQHFVDGHEWYEDVEVVLCFDARGAGGPSILFQTGSESGGLVRTFADCAPNGFGTSMAPAVYERMPNDTDFTVHLGAGREGLNFAFIGGGRAYHTERDRPEALDPGSLQHHGESMLALLRSLHDADLEALLEEEAVEFFPLPLTGLVLLPRSLSRNLSLLLGVAGLASAFLLMRRAGASPLAVSLSLGKLLLRGLGCILLCALVGEVLRMLAHALLAGSYGEVPRLAGLLATEAASTGAWWLVLGLWTVSHVETSPGARQSGAPPTEHLAALVLGSMLALALPLLVPGAAHIAWIPATGLLIGCWLLERRGTGGWALLLAGLPGICVLMPLVSLLAQVGSVSPVREPLLAAAFSVLLLGALSPLLAFELPRRIGRAPGLLWALAGVLVLILRGALDVIGR